jgi:thiamine-phosphate pyrophosphorylase
MHSAPLMRILDASLNRAGEGLRVVEDYLRFVLDDPFLTGLAKSLRHDLIAAAATVPADHRHAARDALHDVGTGVTAAGEGRRDSLHQVCAASIKRTEQSLRSLEEYGKLADGQFAAAIESLRYRLYTLEKAIDVGRSSRERLEGVRLCVLTDGRASPADFESLVAAMIEARVPMIQLRDKRLDDRELIDRARLLRQLTRSSPTLTVINDRPDIAAAVGADGVHLGQQDLPLKDARAVVGTAMLIGISTHNLDQARTAVLDGANYLGAGPTFASQTKNFDQFAGLEYLRELAAEVRLPTFAIGGITAENLPSVLATGIARVAVGSSITAAQEPASAAREFLGMLNEHGR